MNFRRKNFLISFVYPFVVASFLKLANLEGFVLYGTLIVSVLVNYFLCFWVFNFNVQPTGLLTVLVLPSIWYGALIMTYVNIFVDLRVVVQLGMFLFFGFLTYYLITTQNLLNVSMFRSVSLSQAAYTSNNFYTILTFFLATASVLLIPEFEFWIKIIMISFSFFLVFLIFVQLNNIEIVDYVISSVFFSFVLLIILSLWLLGLTDSSKLILNSLVFTLVFKWFLILSLNSNRKIVSVVDYITFIFEFILFGWLIYYQTI